MNRLIEPYEKIKKSIGYDIIVLIMKPRIVFMGSPEFAIPSLRALHKEYPIVGVVTQMDKPSGRGQKLTPPPIKQVALQLGLPIIQPRRLKEEEAMQQLHSWAPDLIIVVAYGQILRQEVLDLPRYGCINVHASLLPRWRGAAPIQAALLNGDQETGITIMKMDAGMDTGDILSQTSIPILPNDDASTLSQTLSHLGADLLMTTLPRYLLGEITSQPQDHAQATYAPKIEKTDGELNFHLPANVLERQVRAYNPWPAAYTFWKGEPLKVLKAHADRSSHSYAPAARLVIDNKPAIAAAEGILILDLVQPAGRKPLPADQFLRGAKGWLS